MSVYVYIYLSVCPLPMQIFFEASHSPQVTWSVQGLQTNIFKYFRWSKKLQMNIRIYSYWRNGTNTNTNNIWGQFFRILKYLGSSLLCMPTRPDRPFGLSVNLYLDHPIIRSRVVQMDGPSMCIWMVQIHGVKASIWTAKFCPKC